MDISINAYSINTTTNDTSSTFQFNTAGCFLSVLIGLPTNSYVIWLIVSAGQNGIASEFFSFNLFVCEIALCLQSFVSLLSSTYTELWMLVRFLMGFSMTGRPLFQCLICVERYVAVIYPITFLKFKPLRYKAMCSSVFWIIVLSSCVFSVLCVTLDLFYLLMCFALGHGLLNFSVQSFCCLAVLRALKQSGPGERGREREEENHMKRKAFHIILIIIIATTYTYFVYVIVTFNFLLTNTFSGMLWSVGHVCFVLGGLTQPFLYLHRIGKLTFCKAP